jgi:hypothetical protein
MANYYYITIKSEKMTQELANKILEQISQKQLVRSFNFHEGYLFYNTRGLYDISELLKEYKIDTKLETLVMDEFNYGYYHMEITGQENFDLEKIKKDIEHDIKAGKFCF